MALLFSKVTLTAENGNTASLLCPGCPKDGSDLEDWIIYQKFMSDNLNSRSIKAGVDTYLYGDGQVYIANIYEIAYFTGRGEDFLQRSTVLFQGHSSFNVYPPVRTEVNVSC